MKRKLYLVTAIIFLQAHKPFNEQHKKHFQWSRTFAECMHQVNEKHFKDIDVEQAFLHAMKGYIQHDPYSSILTKKELEHLKRGTTGTQAGIGVVLQEKKLYDASIIIKDVLPHSGAEKMGLAANDQIIEIEGENAEGLSTDDIVALLQGANESTVTIKYVRNGKEQSCAITRSALEPDQDIALFFDEYAIAYAKLVLFQEQSYQHLDHLFTAAHKHRSHGVIIDLRNNTGGLLHAAVECASLFLPLKTPIVLIKDRHKKIHESHYTKREPRALGRIPIIILVNEYTASSAEIFAGTLQYNSHKSPVFIVGRKTFGKGTVQEVIPLNDECALKLTTGTYYFPDGRCLQGNGVLPDIELMPLGRICKPEEDPQVHMAITLLKLCHSRLEQDSTKHLKKSQLLELLKKEICYRPIKQITPITL